MDLLDCEELFRTNEDLGITSEDDWFCGEVRFSSTPLDCASPASSDDDLFEPQCSTLAVTVADGDGDDDLVEEDERQLRCWRHFERHFDYMVDRILRPVEEYALGRSPLMDDADWNPYQPSQGHVTAAGGFFSGCNGTALQNTLAGVVNEYKRMCKDMFGGYECSVDERSNALQFSVECDFQHLVESGDTVETPCIGSLVDDAPTTNVSRLPVDDSSRRDISNSVSCSVKLFSATSPYGDEAPMSNTHHSNIQPIRNTLQCPGYVRHEGEMIVLLEKHGFDAFYDFMDQMFVGLEGCRMGTRYVYALELLTSVLRLMPEFIVLLIRPKLSSSTDCGRRLCYLKRLIIIVRSFLKYMDLEPEVPVSDMYRDASNGCFIPFYLLIGDKDLQNRQAKSAMTATLLLKLFTLVRLIGDKCMDWVFLSTVSAVYSCRLIQRLKRFVYMPLFSMKQVHELVVPLSANFPCADGCLFDFDYLQWVKSYLHPPPPLYMLRSELVKLIRLCVLTTRTTLNGWYRSINEALIVGNARARGTHYDDVLRRHLFLLIGGLSFVLVPEFLSLCVGNLESFFGSFCLLLPHVQYSLQSVDLDHFVEKETYMLQEQVLDLLKVMVDAEMLSHDNLLGLQGIPTVQSTIVRRILGLAWHYTTSPSLEGNDGLVDMHPVIKMDDCQSECQGQCMSLAPYSGACSIDFLSQMKHSSVRFHQTPPILKEVQCVFTTADELESKVRNQEEFVNHSRISENDYTCVVGGISESNPVEIICSQDGDSTQRTASTSDDIGAVECTTAIPIASAPCTLVCMLRRHMLCDSHSSLDALRWSVVLQGVTILARCLGDCNESASPLAGGNDDALGPTTPIWHALIDLLCSAQLRGELPTRPSPSTYALRESFLGRPVV